MSIKFTRSGSPVAKLSILDDPKLTLPDADWAIGFTIIMNNTFTSYASQAYQGIMRTAADTPFAGGIAANWIPPDSGGTNAGKIYFYAGSTSGRCHTPPLELGKAYVVVYQRVGGALVSMVCPILNSAPADDSSVVTSAVSPYSGGALNGSGGLVLGEAVVANRRFEHSLDRFFRVDRALTGLEVAQLAYGREITQIASPKLYIRMNDVNDFADQGALAMNVLSQGALTTGPNPGYAYSSLPVAPTILGKPAISGSAVVGQLLNYTPPTAMGNPFPTLTQQWTLDNVAIAGATGLSYTPVASNVGKQLRVVVTAINSEGTATSTSDPVLVANEEAGLTLDEQIAEKIYQEINGSAIVPVSGTYFNVTPVVMEYQLYATDGATVVKAWEAFPFSIDNDTYWSANISMAIPPHGKKYLMAVREKNAQGQVMVATPVCENRFGVGQLLLTCGSSSPLTWFGDGSGWGIISDPAVASAIGFNSSGAPTQWGLFGTTGRAGQMATYIGEQLGMPVGFTCVAQGGSSLRDWQDVNSGLHARIVNMVAFLGGKLGGVFLSAGSNDITGNGAALTVDAHLQKLRQFATNVRNVTGQPNLPVLLSGINRRGDALDFQATNARTAERDFGDDPNVYHCQMMDIEVEGSGDPAVPGGVHPTGNGYRVQTERVQRVWAAARGKNPVYLRGPKISRIEYNGPTITVTVQHRNGTDLAPNAMKGFVVSDASGSVGILSTTRKNANQITIICDRTLNNPVVKYLTGAWPLSNEEGPQAVFDTATFALPMTVESFMPAVAGSAAVYTPVFRTFDFNYAIDSAIVSAPKQYMVGRTFLFNYAIDGLVDTSTGSFTTYQLTSSGTLRKNQPYKATWFKGGQIGTNMANETHISGVTDANGRATFDAPFGPGLVLVEFGDGGVCLQKGTVS